MAPATTPHTAGAGASVVRRSDDLAPDHAMTTPFPTLFLSHGSPLHALHAGVAGRTWAALARALPKPRAILMASAHWETSLPLLTGSRTPQTVHDFGGFPRELYALSYPAPGAPEVAARAVDLLREAGITAGIDGCRGLDHGAWVPLLYMYPAHDVPVVQLSLQPDRGAAHHVALGRALAPLAGEGVLIVGSGHATHNLRDYARHGDAGAPLPYVSAFTDWLADCVATHDVASLVAYRELAPGAERAHPSEEHYLPLLVAIGTAAADARPERFLAHHQGGALAMDGWLFRPPSATRVKAA